MRRSIEVEVEAPPERVWAVMTDVERWPEWAESVTAVTRLDEGDLRVGSRARVEQPKLPPSEYAVTELVPGRSFTWVASAPGVRTTALHEVEQLGEGRSRVRLQVDQTGLLGRVMGRLFFTGLTDRYLAAEAAGLTARAEGRR